MQKRLGKHTIVMEYPPSIISAATIAGKKEGEGPLSEYYDEIVDDALFGEETWEKSESKFIKSSIAKAIQKANLKNSDINYICAGDLMNQCTGSTFGIRETEIPFFGLYGACSTMAESLSIATVLVDGGFADYVVAATSSHFCSAEKQFRYPLEYGGQRPPTSQWTVTGSGAVVLAKGGDAPKVTHITTGKIVDMGITDINNMGAAMAPVDVIIGQYSL